MSVELKPCPFCVGKARVSDREMRYYGKNYIGHKKLKIGVQVICNRCYARGALVSSILTTGDWATYRNCLESMKEDALEMWNRRAET